MNFKSYIITICSLSTALLFVSCEPVSYTNTPKPQHHTIRKEGAESSIRKDAQKFLDITQLGTIVINDLNNVNKAFKGLDKNKQLFIAKVDNLTIGQEISGLNQWDIAFENGLIKGLLGKNFKVSEKLDYVKIR